MGKKKQTSTQTYTQIEPRDTKDTTALRGLIQNADFASPVVNSFGQMEKQVGDEYYEDDLTDEAVSRIKAGKLFNLKMNKGAALSDAENREHEYKTQAMASLAAGTAPRIVSSGGTQTQSGGFLGDLAMGALGGAAQIGSGFAA